MAMKYLGETLDIHTGGIDLAFPHHENEIAQSEAATGKHFVKYWLHAEHLLVEGEKMSKSLGNFYTLRDLFAKGYKPSALRFALASVPYRRQLNFTFDGLQQASSPSSASEISPTASRKANFRQARTKACPRASPKPPKNSTPASPTTSTPRAPWEPCSNSSAKPTSPWTRVNSPSPMSPPRKNSCRLLTEVFSVIENNDAQKLKALGYGPEGASSDDAEIEKLVAERQAARQSRDFATADRIRKELEKRGIILEDSRDGSVRWKRK